MTIGLSWYGLPQYAARLFCRTIELLGEPCVVVGSRPFVPVEGMDRVLGVPIHWVDGERPVRWRDIGLDVPRIFVQSGWAYPSFSALGNEVKAAGGKVIGLSDANWRGDLRQLVLGPLAFRLKHRTHFDAMLVPGREGVRLMRWFGIPAKRTRVGMYGADPALFGGGPPLATRPKTFLFVGQFIARKDVLGLADAFLEFAKDRPDWSLHLVGGGEQQDSIPRDPRIRVEAFVQPEELARRFHTARFFVLPSVFEAWGLVAHEAALSGCGLVLSNCVGSAEDLCTPTNGVRFKAGRKDDLVRALTESAAFDETRLTAAEAESRRLAAQFGPDRFALEVSRLIQELGES